jgi:toxin-antitoxin system PIN domain toxin
VIVLDANVLLYAYSPASPEHGRARECVADLFSAEALVGLPWQTISAFIRILTNPRLPGVRRPVTEILEIVESWLEQPNIRLLSPGERHWTLFRQMLLEGQARGPMTSDAQLAALTIESGGVLYTTDRDFARFPGLRWENPLV